jgi:hypothetical protein
MPLDNNSGVTAITYREADKRRIYAFVNGGDHLYVNYWDGTSWHWANQGGVPGGFQGLKHLNTPTAITYQQGGKQRIYAFLVGDDNIGSNARLHVNYWDGSAWHWADQGTPAGATLNSIPRAITYSEGGKQRIYVFVVGSENDLHVNYWDGVKWHWADQGHPSGASQSIGLGGNGVVSYAVDGKQRIYAFAPGGKHLYVDYWDGAKWHWADQGTPFPQTDNSLTQDSAVTFKEVGTQHIEEYVIATDGKLRRNYWDGSNWNWSSPTAPLQTNLEEMIGAIHYQDEITDKERVYIFITGHHEYPDRHLYVYYRDGNSWHWADQGKPPGIGADTLRGAGSVITFQEGGKQLIYAFVNATNGHLYVNYWDGSSWHWADQGKP